MFLTLSILLALLTTGPYTFTILADFWIFAGFISHPQCVCVSEQDLQHTNSLCCFFFFFLPDQIVLSIFSLQRSPALFFETISWPADGHQTAGAELAYVLHDFLYQLLCLSASIIHLRTREVTSLRSMDPTDPVNWASAGTLITVIYYLFLCLFLYHLLLFILQRIWALWEPAAALVSAVSAATPTCLPHSRYSIID